MAHKALKGRRKPRTEVKKSLKASAKPGKNNLVKKAPHQFKNQKAAQEFAKKQAEALAKAQEAKKALKAAKAEKKVAAVAEAAVSSTASAAAPGAVAAAPKLTKKEQKIQQELVKQNLKLYEGGERILLVGEGNFSFARALCRKVGGAGVYATAFDSEAVLNKKYPDAAECRKEVEELGGTTLVGVDATLLHKIKEFRGAFSKVVWNFPHIGGGEKDVETSIADHRKLLGKFFESAARCLDPEKPSQIHVAVKLGEPYKSWKVVQVARTVSESLHFQTAVPFVLAAWPGYAHRRTLGFSEAFSKKDNEELQKGAKVYVFVQKPFATEE